MKPALATALMGLLFLQTLSVAAPAPPSTVSGHKTRFVAARGKVRIEGTSSIDDWQVESKSIDGFLEVTSEFLRPGAHSSLTTGTARSEVILEVHTLKSIEKDGKPFSNKMDDIMYESLKAHDHPKIRYRLGHLVLKHAGKTNDAANEYDVRGHLSVAGVTNEITMVVSIQSHGPGQLRIWGSTTVKMTDFQIDPPAPKIALGLIKTGDEVKLSFDSVWSRRD